MTDKPDLALKSEIPTKVSLLENDSGYLTEHQSLSDYYTKEQTDQKISQKQDAYELISRDGKQKIEGDRLVYESRVVHEFGPWTRDNDGTVDETWQLEQNGPTWIWRNQAGQRSLEWYNKEEAENATSFYTDDTYQVWSRTETSHNEWFSTGELALTSDISASEAKVY